MNRKAGQMPTTKSSSGQKLRQLAEREQRVFATYPLVARYFAAAAIEDARQRLTRIIDRGDGPGLVIGAPGTGKSLLLQVLATQYHSKIDVVLLACARLCTRRALLQAVLFELGLPYKIRDEGELRLSLLDHLLSDDCPAGLLLLVDEAQALPTALLDELRILTNLVRGGMPRVRLILAGSSTLEEAFAHPELESFSQRLSARCYLAPLNAEETRQYIRAQISACGAAPDEVFAGDAAAAVFDATDGVPRLVNQLCDRALQFAVADSASCVNRQTIQHAWSDLQQIPTPWEAPSVETAASSDVIEFGKLSVDRFADVPEVDADVAIDDTELDSELDEIVTQGAYVTVSHSAPVTAAVSVAASPDPFAEKFDDEEVVLDNFAGWDEAFRRDAQKVENRRDPGFASLVQSAIAASPVSAGQLFATQAIGDDLTVDAPSWPRLRLADVADSLSTDHAVAPSAVTRLSQRSDALELLSAFVSSKVVAAPVENNEPMLVIEEDTPQNPPPSPVRREEYRHLFSRLRSG
jgi:type II secretory pathway predicted ATPase ExeA